MIGQDESQNTAEDPNKLAANGVSRMHVSKSMGNFGSEPIQWVPFELLMPIYKHPSRFKN